MLFKMKKRKVQGQTQTPEVVLPTVPYVRELILDPMAHKVEPTALHRGFLIT